MLLVGDDDLVAWFPMHPRADEVGAVGGIAGEGDLGVVAVQALGDNVAADFYPRNSMMYSVVARLGTRNYLAQMWLL